jgi:cytochrome oxidase Cu insertion factor (SCO1/SenC/PrrC family)
MRITLTSVALAAFLVSGGLAAQEGKDGAKKEKVTQAPKAEGPKIEAGKPAPDFTLKDQDGKDLKLASFRGKKGVLIAFYPKDFTGG